MKKQDKGITLIALIITIIVLLILAGVAISTLTGENGILTQAETAKTNTTKAEAEERFKLIANEWQIAKAQGTSLEDFLEYKKESGELDNITQNSDGTFKIENNEYKETIHSEKGLLGDNYRPPFNPETLEIGKVALNSEKYGWKVKDYTVTTTDCPSGVWRLFYQDSKYTYLINDELTATTYNLYEHYSSYANGVSVSTVGQKLSPMISSLFTESNTNANIRFTAGMTDPEVWKDYLDPNGDAVFAIGSPTAELFAASYNATGKSNTITLGFGEYGYTENITCDWLSESDNYGIYNKSITSSWWLASPDGDDSWVGLGVTGTSFLRAYLDEAYEACRPIVCIPTSVFNSNYSDSVVDEQ